MSELRLDIRFSTRESDGLILWQGSTDTKKNWISVGGELIPKSLGELFDRKKLAKKKTFVLEFGYQIGSNHLSLFVSIEHGIILNNVWSY